jgi:hypothetical protein
MHPRTIILFTHSFGLIALWLNTNASQLVATFPKKEKLVAGWFNGNKVFQASAQPRRQQAALIVNLQIGYLLGAVWLREF